MLWHLFLDESGDLGFDFDTNASKFLTVSVLAVSDLKTVKKIRWAVTKTLRRKINKQKKSGQQELKGGRTALAVKQYFYRQIASHKFGVYAMTLDKRRVPPDLFKSAATKDQLYNFVARKVLDAIPFERADAAVTLVVDKSKGKDGMRTFNESMENQLKGRLDPKVPLSIFHRDSCLDGGLSAADLFCWGVFRKHERDDTRWFDVFADKVRLDERYQ